MASPTHAPPVRGRLLATAAAAAFVFGLSMAPRQADAAIVERIVAVVGERPILLSELRHRARPYLYRIAAAQLNPAQQAAEESKAFKDVLNRMIDDRLEEHAADKGRIVVTPEEVDAAVRNVAAQAKVKPSDLIAEVKRQGLSEQDYRDELRRQLLEGKLVQLRVRGRVRVSEQDARTAYAHWLKDMGGQPFIDVRILPLRILPGSTSQEAAAREALATEIATRARRGEDFCKLVEQHSDDPATKATCGSHGMQPWNALIPPLQELVKDVPAGETAGPLRLDEAILVVQVARFSPLPRFEEVKDSMMERAFSEVMERQRKLWLAELRRGIYLDVRL